MGSAVKYITQAMIVAIIITLMERERIKASIQNEAIETKSHSLKEPEEASTDVSGIPSLQTLSMFEDEYQLRQLGVQSSVDHKLMRKNHIVVRMCARVNGESVSPDYMKASKISRDFQQNMKSSTLFKQPLNQSSGSSRVASKLLEKEHKVPELKNDNRKPAVDHEEPKNKAQNRKDMRSPEIRSPRIQNRPGDVIPSRGQSSSHIQKLQMKQRLDRLQEAKLSLQKRIVELQSQIICKDKQMKDTIRQNQHEINLLHENLIKRLKAKQVEAHMNSKHLKQQRQKVHNLEKELSKVLEEKCLLNAVVHQNKKEKEKLQGVMREYQQQLRRGKVISMRLQNCENQSKYYKQQLDREKLQNSLIRKQATALQQELSKIKKQLHQIILHPHSNIYSEILLLSESMQRKEPDLRARNQESASMALAEMKKQVQGIQLKQKNASLLLEEGNQQIVKLRLRSLNQSINKQFSI